MRRLHYLKNRVPPSVLATYLRTLLNGWCTKRRMRTATHLAIQRSYDACLFCDRATDCVEHIAHCPTVIEFYSSQGHSLVGLQGLLALFPNDFPLKIVQLAQLLASTYLAHNVLSHHSDTPPRQLLLELHRRVTNKVRA